MTSPNEYQTRENDNAIDSCPGCGANFEQADQMTDAQIATLESDVCPFCEFKLQ